jgi:hypothetical protein
MRYRGLSPLPVVVLIGVMAVLTIGLERALSAPEGPSQGTPPKALLFRGVRTPVAVTGALRAAMAPPSPVGAAMKMRLLTGSSTSTPGSAMWTYVKLTPRQPYVENRGYLNFITSNQVLSRPPFDAADFHPPTSPAYTPSVHFAIRSDAGSHRYLLDFAVGTSTMLMGDPSRVFRVSHGGNYQDFRVGPAGQHLFVVLDTEGPYEYGFAITCTSGIPWHFYSVEATTLS